MAPFPSTLRHPQGERERGHDQDGAALVVAIGVMTVLLAISLTFFNMTSQELDSASNVSNRVKAELLVDGAFAMGIGFLNHDLLIHPSYTSTDHAWRTYFNGAWAAGKPWMWDSGVTGVQNELNGPATFFNSPNPVAIPDKAVPLIDMAAFPHARDGLYVPRVDTITFPGDIPPRPEDQFAANLIAKFPPVGESQADEPYPYVIQNDPLISNFVGSNPESDRYNTFPSNQEFPLQFSGTGHTAQRRLGDILLDQTNNPVQIGILTAAQQVDMWADVDNDGDGLKDSAWIPIAADRLFPGDGLDNDLDGLVDAAGRDGDLDTRLDNDADGEPGLFLYRANTNGIDDNGDGVIDDSEDEPGSEFRMVVLTMPIEQMFSVGPRVRYGANGGAIPQTGPPQAFVEWDDDGNSPPSGLQAIESILALAGVRTVDVLFEEDRDGSDGTTRNPPDVPPRDNDYSILISDGVDGRGYLIRDIPDQNSATGQPFIHNPYAEIAYDAIWPADNYANPSANLFPAAPPLNLDSLAAVFQIYGEPITELVGRMAILINDEASKVNVAAAGGVSYGDPKILGNTELTPAQSDGAGPWEYDTRVLPGIGDALSAHTWQLMMGATGGLGLSPALDLGDADVTPATFAYALDLSFPGYGRADDDGNALWLSMNGIDDDGDGVIDEGINPAYPRLFGLFEGIDEPSEYRAFQPYRNTLAEDDVTDNDQDDVTDEIGEYGDRNLRTDEQIKLVSGIGAGRYETVRNLITVHSADKNERHLFRELGQSRNVSGLKLNYSLLTGQEAADSIVGDGIFSFPTSFDSLNRGFDSVILPEMDDGGGDVGRLDPLFRPSEIEQAFATGLRLEGLAYRLHRYNAFPPPGLLSGLRYQGGTTDATVTIGNDPELRAMQIAVNAKDGSDDNFARSEATTSIRDDWWNDLIAPGQSRDITYKVAGAESIRINEIMVRAVRRVEAEIGFGGSIQFTPNPGNVLGLPTFNVASLTAIDPLGLGVLTGGTFGPLVSEWASLPGRSKEYLGDNAFVSTTQDFVPFVGPGVPQPRDVAQWIFGPSSGLPAGRYYLSVNTSLIDETGRERITVPVAENLEFAIKYISESPGPRTTTSGTIEVGLPQNQDPAYMSPIKFVGILDDVMRDEVVAPPRQYDDIWHGPLVGNEAGIDPAWVFLPGELQAGAVVPPLEGYTNTGLTVVVPEPTGLDLEPIYLCVAVRMPTTFVPRGWETDGIDNDGDLVVDALDPDELDRLAINFFDFSQEPDHEWIELVNLDKSFDPINLSGWELEVGYGPGDPNRRVLTIPGDPNAAYGDPDRPATFIEPGGMLLLATNKFDEFQNPDVAENIEHRNTNRILYGNGIGLARGGGGAYASVTAPPIGTAGNNVFDRPALLDFVDTDGNGAEDAALMRSEDEYYSSSDITGSVNGNFQEFTKAWDRIVELISPDMAIATTSQDVADFVLRGGVFPNYPESDGIDNDGDNAVLTTDLVDNDGDNAFLADFNLGIDEVVESEGVDEGRWMRDNLGATIPTTLFSIPGAFGVTPAFYAAAVGDFDLSLTEAQTQVSPGTGQISAPYLVSAGDPPDWKELIERRFFPGDNVIVTLYEGRASGGRIADRVTYTQRDVENRQIDELIPSPYLDGVEVVSLQGNLPGSSFWPDNAMALDFYRSLERKHPLYNGDRFGTTNRWEATDGNYDDWAPSTGYYEAVFDAFTLVATPTGVLRTSALFTHAFSGSPLRMNLSQRLIDNPQLNILGDHEFTTPADPATWRTEFAQVPARGTKSTGSLAQTPHFTLTVDLSPNTGGGTIDANLNPLDAYSPVVNLLLRVPEVLAGDGVQDGLRSIMDGGSFDTLTLTAAQADFEAKFSLVLPEPNDIATWVNVPPLGWAPVFLFDLPGALGRPETFNYKYEFAPNLGQIQRDWISIGAINAMVYLFSGDALQLQQPAFSQGLSPTDLTERWSVFEPGFGSSQVEQMAQPRVAFFAAANRADVSTQAAATFEWDGADGVENGEYDVYIATVENLAALQDTRLLAAGMLTDFAVSTAFTSKIGTGADKRPTSYAVDVEVFTDRNLDGGVDTDPASPDSFGPQAGVTPSDDGIVHYGIVRVEGNKLVVGLRNRGVSGALNRFSRVVLAPRQKTRGRININTAETKPVPSDQAQYASIPNDLVDPDLFNPLTGLPGILSRLQFSIGSTSAIIFPGDTAVPTSSVAAGLIAADSIDRTSGFGNEDIFYRAREIVLGRPDHYDGRYYEYLADLAAKNPVSLQMNRVLSKPYDVGITGGTGFNEVVPNPTILVRQAAEVRERLSRMTNLITTRSDVFEILVTVQAGYGVDENNDGHVNYRSDREFISTSEQHARMIYER